MSDGTHIEWTDATWNIVTGCSVVSAGCTNCYAMRLAGTRLKQHPSRAGLTKEVNGNHVWTGEVRFNAAWLDQPLRWAKPRRIFVAAHGDLFHEGVKDEWLDQIFAIMALTPRHTYQVLTKRPDRMRAYMLDKAAPYRIARPILDLTIAGKLRNMSALPNTDDWPVASEGDIDDPSDIVVKAWPLPNVWLGTSIENQDTADARIPELLDTPAAVRWISAEPLLEKLHLDVWLGGRGAAGTCIDIDGYWWHKPGSCRHCRPGLDWVVVGGESGPGARPMHPEWAQSIRDQCSAAGVPFFFKQWGSWSPGVNVSADIIGIREHASWFADDWVYGETDMGDPEANWDDEPDLYRVGKKAAGDLLDGVQHHNWPEVRS